MKLYKGYKHKGSISGIIVYFMGKLTSEFNPPRGLTVKGYLDHEFNRKYFAEKIIYDPST